MKIMFVMLKTMGDVVLGTTICRELRKDFPDAEIHFYTNAPYGELILNNPDIARVHESQHWYYDQLFMEICKGEYDHVYLPYQMRPECNVWHQMEETRHQHLVDFYWKRMGMHRLIEERECYLFPEEKNFMNANKFLEAGKKTVAMHSTSGVATKDWPFFNQLCSEVLASGMRVVQVGSRSDKIIEGAEDLRGKMSIIDLAAFLGRCDTFVGLDSGLSYIADAMKIRTIVIQGSTDPVTSGPISGRVIHLFAEKTGYDDCQVVRCHMNCRHEVNCNTKISVKAVLEKISDLFLTPSQTASE